VAGTRSASWTGLRLQAAPRGVDRMMCLGSHPRCQRAWKYQADPAITVKLNAIAKQDESYRARGPRYKRLAV